MNWIVTFILLVFANLTFAEEYEIKPSVWGTADWTGGYEVYKTNKLGVKEKVATVKPSPFGADEWTGGYEVKKVKNGTEKKAGEVKPSVWGTTNWTGGYKVKLDDDDLNEAEKKALKKQLDSILSK